MTEPAADPIADPIADPVTSPIADPITVLARQHAPDVLAEALRQATARATAALADKLTVALLTAAHEPPEPAAPPAPPVEPRPEPVADGQSLWAYAITRARRPEPGLPELITHRGLALAVRALDRTRLAELDEWDGSAELAEDSALAVLVRDHDATVRAVGDAEPVLPLRFGTVFADRAAAIRLLAAKHDEVADWLDRVADHREWGVRVRTPAPTQAPEPTPTEDISGTAYLTRRQHAVTAAEHARRARADRVADVHHELANHATDTRRRSSAQPGLLLDAAYLVPVTKEAAFRAEVDRLNTELTGEHGEVGEVGEVGEIELTGPWPPYSFVDLELTAEAGGRDG